jgi:hypothetical protein
VWVGLGVLLWVCVCGGGDGGGCGWVCEKGGRILVSITTARRGRKHDVAFACYFLRCLRAPVRDLVVVLPTLPVMPTTGPRNRSRTSAASRCVAVPS